jgi:hypothetical protein
MTNTKTKTKNRPKGYYWDNDAGKYRSQITINGEKIHLGYFSSEKKAAQAYKSASNAR